MKFIRSFYIVFVVCVATSMFAGNKTDPRLSQVVQHLSPTDHVPAWVFFSDKGSHESLKASVPHNVVSARSIRRRLKVRSMIDVVDYTDVPVEQRYVEQIAPHVQYVRQISKWFNAASVEATQNQIEQIEALPFVSRIELVTRYKRNPALNEIEGAPTHPATPNKHNQTFSFDYGASLAQLNLINVPAVHNTGNYGQGVIVGSFDNGFRLLNHEAFDTLRTRIIATHDFVDHKVSVVPNNPDPGFGAHGIITLSTLAGFKPGQLIGPAFGASFILARTENDSSETPFEEDNWVAAIEWADSLGVDVTSTSLGYLAYDPPSTSWTWENMNGNTTIITRAADMAVSKGIVVVNSAGNNGLNTSHNTLNAPADGDSVLSIGASNSDGSRASFSSVGPTTSIPPRIKPDVMAQGVSVLSASPTNPTFYTYSQGTSLSCPLAAGVVALLLHADTNASPLRIANVLRQTASQASSPDNLNGWGIINAVSAITALTGVNSGTPVPTSYALLQNYPNPFNPKTTIIYNLPQFSTVSLKIYNVLGQEVKTLVNERQSIGLKTSYWDTASNGSNSVASGVYFARLVAQSLVSSATYNATIKLVFLK